MAKHTEPVTRRAETTTEGRKPSKSVVGRVVSNKMQNTVVVAVQWTLMHPQYKKVVRRTTRYMAHDTRQSGMGDLVRLEETRPLSKRKRWRVVSILERSVGDLRKRAEEPPAS